MLHINNSLCSLVQQYNLDRDLFLGNFGLERENVRVTGEGHLSLNPHPKAFGDKSKHLYITTDFSESQLEIITPIHKSLDQAYDMLDTLTNIVTLNLEGDYLWPQSLPPILPKEADIPIARFTSDEAKDDAYNYRQALAEKYGKKKQLVSGIHYNFSFDDLFLKELYEIMVHEGSYESFKDEVYLKLMRYTIKNSWLLIYLLGSSPAAHTSYLDYCGSCNSGVSIRNGRCGYRNTVDYYLPMDSVANYRKALKKLIKKGDLIEDKEYYGLIRPKTADGHFPNDKKPHIEYIELRLFDINPLFKNGIHRDDLKLIHLFLLNGLLSQSQDLSVEAFSEAMKNNRLIADYGRGDVIHLSVNGKECLASEEGKQVLLQMAEIGALNKDKLSGYPSIIKNYLGMLEDKSTLYTNRLYEEINKKGFIEYHLDKAQLYKKMSQSKEFNVSGYEGLELSTQILIRDALLRGIKVELLDSKDNFIKLTDGDHTEWVKQATKTSLDNYSAVLAMENKIVTKKILLEKGIQVPTGLEFQDINQAKASYDRLKDKKIVIKPNGTNFGLGISIFKESFNRADFEKAVSFAFEYDQTILIESFIEGKEYRVFVIGDEVVGVLHRVPANVTGDGYSTIEELIHEKNKSPLRGTGYRKPLQKINIGKEEELFLAQSARTFTTIPDAGEVVYLRENSNISTGGDSIDFTDDLSAELKAVAIKSAKAMNATITGVDMMIKDVSGPAQDNYSIIEMNFNPAIHIHCFPFIGKDRKLGEKILNILGF